MERVAGVYVLRLRTHGCYYVGLSQNVAKRIDRHHGGKGAAFVKMCDGVEGVEAPITANSGALIDWEKNELLTRMMRHGYNRVRGWELTQCRPLDANDIEFVKRCIFGMPTDNGNGRCRKCGRNGHFCDACRETEKAPWLRDLESLEERSFPLRVSYQGNCTRCGREGHDKKECSYKSHVNGYPILAQCARCSRTGHAGFDCSYTFHISGRRL